MLMNLIVVLLMFVAIGAVIAIWMRDLLSALIAMGVVGFTRTVVFVLLRAPDVAITQVVVEVLLLIILIRSAVRREVHTVEAGRNAPGMAVAAAFVVVMLVLGVIAIRELAPFGQPLEVRAGDAPSMTYIKEGKNQTGCGNIVTAVLLDYRGYDTLGEATVLFTAVVGAVVLLRRKSRKSADEAAAPEPAAEAGPAIDPDGDQNLRIEQEETE